MSKDISVDKPIVQHRATLGNRCRRIVAPIPFCRAQLAERGPSGVGDAPKFPSRVIPHALPPSCWAGCIAVLTPFLSPQRATASSHARPKTLLHQSAVS